MTRSGVRRFDAYIFDLDGTIYVGDELIPGADETIARLRADGARVAFVTNNPLHPSAEHAPARAEAVGGDRRATGVAMGQLIGASGILVLSGATSAAEAPAGEVRPDHTLGSIRDLIP